MFNKAQTPVNLQGNSCQPECVLGIQAAAEASLAGVDGHLN